MSLANRALSLVLAALCVIVAGRPAAGAAAGTFVSLGGASLFSDPSCVADGTESAVCMGIGEQSQPIVDRYAKGVWGGWKSLTGTILGKPGCARIAAGVVSCGARDPNDALVAYHFAAGAWTGPVTAVRAGSFAVRAVSPASGLASDPSCVGLATDRALCAALDVNGNIASAVFNGTTWTALPAVPATAFGAINCTGNARGVAICVWPGAANHIMSIAFSGTRWLGALDLGGRAFGAPGCTDSGLKNGNVLCYGVGLDSGLYGNEFVNATWQAGSWSGWSAAGGSMTGSGCAEDGAHGGYAQYRCVATGVPDGTLWVYTAGQPWASLGGGGVIGTPACVALDTTVFPGRVLCVARTVNDRAVSTILAGGP